MRNKTNDLPKEPLIEWYYNRTKYPLKEKDTQQEYEPQGVYVFYNSATRLYKIGITSTPRRRSRALSTSSGCDVNIILYLELQIGVDEKASYIEELMHEYYRVRRKGGEWFSLDGSDLLNIRNLFNIIEGDDLEDWLNNHLNDCYIGMYENHEYFY